MPTVLDLLGSNIFEATTLGGDESQLEVGYPTLLRGGYKKSLLFKWVGESGSKNPRRPEPLSSSAAMAGCPCLDRSRNKCWMTLERARHVVQRTENFRPLFQQRAWNTGFLENLKVDQGESLRAPFAFLCTRGITRPFPSLSDLRSPLKFMVAPKGSVSVGGDLGQ